MPPNDFPYEASFVSSFALSLGLSLGRLEVLTSENESDAPPDDITHPRRLLTRLEQLLGPEPQPIAANVSAWAGSSDKIFADAIASFRDHGILIEFKRSLEDWCTEPAKDVKKKVLSWITGREHGENGWTIANQSPKQAKIEECSRKAHWFAYGANVDSAEEGEVQDMLATLDLKFSAYADLVFGEALDQEALAMNIFIERFVKYDVGLSLAELTHYVTEMGEAGGDPKASEASTAGILVYLGQTGRLRLLWFRSITELQDILEKISISETGPTSHIQPPDFDEEELSVFDSRFGEEQEEQEEQEDVKKEKRRPRGIR